MGSCYSGQTPMGRSQNQLEEQLLQQRSWTSGCFGDSQMQEQLLQQRSWSSGSFGDSQMQGLLHSKQQQLPQQLRSASEQQMGSCYSGQTPKGSSQNQLEEQLLQQRSWSSGSFGDSQMQDRQLPAVGKSTRCKSSLDLEDFALFGDAYGRIPSPIEERDEEALVLPLHPSSPARQTLVTISEDGRPRTCPQACEKPGAVAHDGYSSVDEDACPETDTELVIGPTEFAASSSSSLSSLSIPVSKVKRRHAGRQRKSNAIQSTSTCVLFSETQLLSKARKVAPLSFGSVQHLAARPGQDVVCRPCMFETQRPGKCKKSWLCDFCHMNHPRARVESKKDGPNSSSFKF